MIPPVRYVHCHRMLRLARLLALYYIPALSIAPLDTPVILKLEVVIWCL